MNRTVFRLRTLFELEKLFSCLKKEKNGKFLKPQKRIKLRQLMVFRCLFLIFMAMIKSTAFV